MAAKRFAGLSKVVERHADHYRAALEADVSRRESPPACVTDAIDYAYIRNARWQKLYKLRKQNETISVCRVRIYL
ncbi:MAG: hypothetical protein NVSMB6_10950 [Burkholderiaceae bacterium]